jgi:hypothetical protein
MAGHLAALDEYLRSAPPLHSLTVPPGGGGHAAKVGIALEGGGAVLAKLDSGAPYEGEMIRREAAAWVVACAMGWPDLMPATVLRSVDWQGRHYEASVQMLWPHVIQPPPRVVDFGYGDSFRAAIFDAITLQANRDDNWLGVPNEFGDLGLKLVDNGMSFGLADLPLESAFFYRHEGDDFNSGHLESMRALLGASEELGQVLGDQTLADEATGRAQALLEAGSLVRV